METAVIAAAIAASTAPPATSEPMKFLQSAGGGWAWRQLRHLANTACGCMSAKTAAWLGSQRYCLVIQ